MIKEQFNVGLLTVTSFCIFFPGLRGLESLSRFFSGMIGILSVSYHHPVNLRFNKFCCFGEISHLLARSSTIINLFC